MNDSVLKGRSPKVDPILVTLGAMARNFPGLEEATGPRAYALEQILDQYGLWTIKTDMGEIPWGHVLHGKLKAWELVKALKSLGDEAIAGMALKPSRKLTLEEALRLLGL